MTKEADVGVTENDVLKALGYKNVGDIVLLCVPARTCGSKEEVYGKLYVTRHGLNDMTLENEFWDELKRADAEFNNLEVLEAAVKKYPESFNPSSRVSIFSTYHGREVVEAYDDKVSINLTLEPGISRGPFTDKKLINNFQRSKFRYFQIYS